MPSILRFLADIFLLTRRRARFLNLLAVQKERLPFHFMLAFIGDIRLIIRKNATFRKTSLAYVLCSIHCRRVVIPGPTQVFPVGARKIYFLVIPPLLVLFLMMSWIMRVRMGMWPKKQPSYTVSTVLVRRKPSSPTN